MKRSYWVSGNFLCKVTEGSIASSDVKIEIYTGTMHRKKQQLHVPKYKHHLGTVLMYPALLFLKSFRKYVETGGIAIFKHFNLRCHLDIAYGRVTNDLVQKVLNQLIDTEARKLKAADYDIIDEYAQKRTLLVDSIRDPELEEFFLTTYNINYLDNLRLYYSTRNKQRKKSKSVDFNDE